MNCPNCGKEMKDESYWHYSIGGWDLDYPDVFHEEYWCWHCCIKFINDTWTVPKSIQATDKQLNVGRLIERNTGIRMPPPIKKLLSEYIGNYLELSKQRSAEYKMERRQDFSEWCEENSDWLPEYY